MKQAYRTFRFSSDTRVLIDFLDRLVGEYQLAHYVLSVRQLYYQLVARDVVPTTEKSYKRVASIITDSLRRCDAIRGRHGRYGFDGPSLRATATGLEVCEDIIRNSSQKQMLDAFVESLTRIRLQGKATGTST